jgi:Ankyrin repeats (3 copies)
MNQQMETAVYLGDKLTIFEIINKSKFVNFYDRGSATSLVMWACAWGWTDLLLNLIDKGAEYKTYCNFDGATALMKASFHGRVDIIEIFIKRGVRMNKKDISGSNAMDYAALSENWKIFRILMNSGGKYSCLIPIKPDWEKVVQITPDIWRIEDEDEMDHQMLLQLKKYCE